MAQFDVLANPLLRAADDPHFFRVLQSDAVAHLRTTVVAPLRPVGLFQSIDRLQPVLDWGAGRHVLAISEIAWLNRRDLAEPVANVGERYRDRIIAALDLLFTGI